MNEDCLKLTTYFGERDRAGAVFLADAFTEIYTRHELQTSLVMRGVETFGTKHDRDSNVSVQRKSPFTAGLVHGS